jgi:hypothetical protein
MLDVIKHHTLAFIVGFLEIEENKRSKEDLTCRLICDTNALKMSAEVVSQSLSDLKGSKVN